MAKKRPKSEPKAPYVSPEIKGVFFLSLTTILLASLISFAMGGLPQSWLGIIGASISWTLHAVLGLGSYILCFYLGWIGWRLAFSKSLNRSALKCVYVILGITSFCLLLTILETHYPSLSGTLYKTLYPQLGVKKLRYHLGGAPFYYLYNDLPLFNLKLILGPGGTGLLFGTLLAACLLLLSKITPSQLLQFLLSLMPKWPEKKALIESPVETNNNDFMRLVKLRTTTSDSSELAIKPETELKERPSISKKEDPKPKIVSFDKEAPFKKAQPGAAPAKNSNYGAYQLPTTELLTTPRKIDQTHLKKDLRKQAEVLEETLLSFGIEAKVGQINCGPTITSFEIHPAIGVKVQKIKTLENDIALNMEAKSIRIIAPIPGKAVVGIEVPNPQPQEVSFREMLQAYQQGSQKFKIPILLGKAVNGDYVMSDLTKMPHCIIAGATGSGKSVCINTIVMSIVMNAKPDEIKLVMVDPKKVELTPYTHLPHMLAPVITEPQGACAALKWLVREMENRYDILKATGNRNIEAFNNRTINKEAEALIGREIPERLPYIVGIIDELADLMMVSSSDIETPIARIAQMARAVGIHLILATQRPSREVITGLIKANFPTRISFKVASRVNSQIVLDEVGAETLLGNGDMLFLPPGASTLIRAQGAYIRDEDINQVVKAICDQAPPNYVIHSFDRMTLVDEKQEEEEPADSLYKDAVDVVLSTGNASTTFLQRKLKIGYARAASIIDQMEAKGIVGPAEGSKPRKILAPRHKKREEGEENDLFSLTEAKLPEDEV